jgi:hypothetical protein
LASALGRIPRPLVDSSVNTGRKLAPWHRVLGWDPQALVGQRLTMLIHPSCDRRIWPGSAVSR